MSNFLHSHSLYFLSTFRGPVCARTSSHIEMYEKNVGIVDAAWKQMEMLSFWGHGTIQVCFCCVWAPLTSPALHFVSHLPFCTSENL